MQSNNKSHRSVCSPSRQFLIPAILISLSRTHGFQYAPVACYGMVRSEAMSRLVSMQAMPSDYGNTRAYKKRTQLRRRGKNNSPGSSRDHYSYSSAVKRNNMDQDSEVFEWLIQSTEIVLGNRWQNFETEDSSSERQALIAPNFASHREYIIEAESVMKSWVKWIDQHPDGLNVNATTFYSYSGAQTVEHILERTLNVYNDWEQKKQKFASAYLTTSRAELVNIAIDAWTRSNKGNDKSIVDSAVRLLRLLEKKNASPILTHANEDTYHGVIKACISSRRSKDLETSISLLEEMATVSTICQTSSRGCEEGAFSGTETTLSPTTQTYNLVLYGLANSKPCVKNALRAESILQQMISGQKSAGCYPDSNTFRQVVSAWTKSGSDGALENAHRVLKMVLSDFPSVPPDPSTYNAIMTMYLRKGQTKEVLDLFDQLACNDQMGPDTYSVNLMLKARTHKPSELSLDEMDEIDGLLEKIKALYHVRPCGQSYNIVIDAWAKNLSPNSANRAESLLDKMEQECRQGDTMVSPDSYTFTSVLNAISHSKLGGRGKGVWAERVFQRMKGMHKDGLVEAPSTPVYNAYLNALISSKEEWAQVKAERVFAKMGRMANTRTYNIMIKLYSTMIEHPNGGFASFARSSKARELLDQMEKSTSPVKPDVFSYTTVICAYSRSNVKRKAMKAFGVLRRMIRSGIRPSIYSFNGVLTACVHTYPREEKVQAFTILVSTLIMIREWTKPDDTTYGVLLKGCERLLPKDETRRKQVLDLVFRELQFQSDPQLHASMMTKFMNMDGGDRGPMTVTE